MATEYPCGFKQPFHSKKPICGVLAVALGANVSFDVAHAACKASMHKLGLGKRFGGRTYMRQLIDALNGFGVQHELTSISGHASLRELVSNGVIDPAKHYIIQIPGHFFTLKNGCVIDQARNNEPLEGHNFNRNKVKSFLEIKGKVWA